MTASYSETREYAQRAAAASSVAAQLREQVTRATGLTSAGFILAGVSVGAWLLGYAVGGQPLYVLAYGGVAVLVVSWAIGRRTASRQAGAAGARPRLREGEQLTMEVALTAKRRLSTFILEERVPALLGQDARLPVASLDAGETASQSYTVDCWRRGVYELGPLVVRWGDPFGLTEREAVLQEPFELLVHPAYEPVQDRPLTRLWEDPPVRPPVSKPWPSGLEFYGMRSYEPGDDVRRIVWRVFARTGQLMVREAEQGITDRMLIVLDQNRRQHSPGVFSDSFEMAARVAASLGVHHLKEGYSVTLEGSEGKLAGPLRGGMSQIMLLDELARAGLGNQPLRSALGRVVAESRGAHVAIVTPNLEDETIAQIRLMVERGTSVVVAAVLWDELATINLSKAQSMGAQVVELRPGTPLALAFRREVGAGRR